MRKLKAGIAKEFLLLLNDKVGLGMMVFLPILLVVIITTIQNSALNLVNNNQIELILSNQDKQALSKDYVASLKQSQLFNIVEEDFSIDELNNAINGSDTPFGLHISENFYEGPKTQAAGQILKRQQESQM